MLLAAAILLVVNVSETYLAVYSGPVQVIVENPRYPLYKLDFPAVTICSNIKAMKSKTQALTMKLFGNSATPEVQEKFQNSLKTISYLRFPLYNQPFDYLESIDHKVYPIPASEIGDIMQQVGPNIDEMMSSCFWRGNRFNCSELFRRQVTEDGFCYSFNSKTADRIDKYSSRNPPLFVNGKLVALRSNSAGKASGIQVLLNSLEHEQLHDDITARGYSVMIHSPHGFPDVSQGLMIWNEILSAYQIVVSLSTTNSDISLDRLDESVRGCVFRKEITDEDVDTMLMNCALFCRMNAILSYCHCVPYFFVNMSDAEICGIEQLNCLSQINVRLRNTNMSTKVPGFPEWSLPLTMNCSCNQPCSYVSYTADLKEIIPVTGSNVSESLFFRDGFAVVDVFYRDMWAVRYIRQAKFGMRDFIVGVGGMAGLLLGCSLVSVVELVCFLCRYFYYISRPVMMRSENHKVTLTYVQPFTN